MSLKYRTSAGTSASNFTDLVVKVGDTLPIGTEVDYDGQTAPAGWQEVAETNLGDVVVDSIRTKNMFDGVVANAYIDTQGVLQNAPDWKAGLNYIPVKQNTEYIVTASNIGTRFIYAEYDSNRTVIGTRKEITPATPFTTSSTTKYVRFCTNNANATNIQLEEGSSATTYSPYQELNNQEVYSTGEIKIGTWIDGKPLYRKVISTTAPSSNDTNVNIYTFTENIENVVNMYGYAYYQSASYKGSINCYISNADYIATWVLVNSNGIPTNIRCRQNNRISAPMKIIIEYTKTTD